MAVISLFVLGPRVKVLSHGNNEGDSFIDSSFVNREKFLRDKQSFQILLRSIAIVSSIIV